MAVSNKIPSLKDYKINENDPAIKLTMEATGISRQEAIKIIKELSYKLEFPKKKRKKQTA